MNTDDHSLAGQKAARAAAEAATAAAESAPVRRYCSFWVGSHLYGIDILEVKEINAENAFTPIHHAPPKVRGYVNIRGQIHLVIDPREPLGLPPEDRTEGKMLLIFKPAVAEASAMLVDRVGDIIEVPEDRIEDDAEQKVPGQGGELATGVCKLDGQLMVVLNPRGFLSVAH
jgi:chemotaxis signal transduction protein